MAWFVRDLLRSAVEEGTAVAGTLAGVEVAAKTGSSSDLRDAWFAGHAGSLITVVWVGLDDGARLGLTGSAAAGPLWHAFMTEALPRRAAPAIDRPGDVVEVWVEQKSGLLVREGRPGVQRELYLRGTLPTRRRWWRSDTPMAVID